jgi:hypothetical protein
VSFEQKHQRLTLTNDYRKFACLAKKLSAYPAAAVENPSLIHPVTWTERRQQAWNTRLDFDPAESAGRLP